MTWLRLIYEFFKTGLFAVGGGLATLPFLQEMGEKTGWFTNIDIMNMIAVSESTPGPMGVNMATYVGNMICGPLGGLVATLSLAAPSIIIIIIISKMLDRFRDSKLVEATFRGLRPASIGMITAACIEVGRLALFYPERFQPETFLYGSLFTAISSFLTTVVNWKGILLAIVIFIGIRKFDKHPIFYIAFAAMIGIFFSF